MTNLEDSSKKKKKVKLFLPSQSKNRRGIWPQNFHPGFVFQNHSVNFSFRVKENISAITVNTLQVLYSNGKDFVDYE